MIRVVAASLSLGACATASAPAPSPRAEAVIAAERTFAADAAVRDTKAAFLAHAAEEAVMVRRGQVVNARRFIAGWPDARDAGQLVWWPVLAGVSQSGDFGFTTGPAVHGKDERFTYYFTVWERQPDGVWRWLIDMGARTPVKPAEGPESRVRVVPVSWAGRSTAATAMAEVRALEAALTREAAVDYPTAHRRQLAPDARVFGLEPAPATGAAVDAALAARPKTMIATPLGGGAARTGDLAYTYGAARWTAGGEETKGSYMRVWQRRPQGWMIVADLISGD